MRPPPTPRRPGGAPRGLWRAVFDTNGDGKLTAANSTFSSFKVLVTRADGTTEAKTLAQLGITEINLRGDATRIELPDGLVITGKTKFTDADEACGRVTDVLIAPQKDKGGAHKSLALMPLFKKSSLETSKSSCVLPDKSQSNLVEV